MPPPPPRSSCVAAMPSCCATAMESTTDELRDLILTDAAAASEEEEEDEAEVQVGLAFLEEPEGPEELLRHRFPDKAGGAPAWLDPVLLPSGESRLCGFCGDPLRFALQFYAPLPAAYHRALFVFKCPSMPCLLLDQREQRAAASGRRRRSVKVFRCQLPRDNAFYSSGAGDSSGDESDEQPETTYTGVAVAPLCHWCGTWKAEKAKYCSEKHRELHLRAGMAMGSYSDGAPSALGSDQAVPFAGAVWPEYAMVREPEEPLNRGANNSPGSSSTAAAHEQSSDDDRADDKDVSEWMDAVEAAEDDACWASFLARISPAQGQVLRFCCGGDADARPLWAAASGTLGGAAPPCAHCGGATLYEMQVMPALLYYFRVETRDPDPLDWATVVVYTCAVSCDGEGGGGGYKGGAGVGAAAPEYDWHDSQALKKSSVSLERVKV